MSRPARGLVRATILVSAAALLSTLLTGCGAGQNTQTSRKHTAVDGININVGDIAIRDARVMPPAQLAWEPGSAAPLSLYLSNLGTDMDRLASVSSTVARAAMMMPEGAPLPSAQPSATANAHLSSAPADTATGSVATPTPSTQTPSAVGNAAAGWQPLALSPGGVMMLSPGEGGTGRTAQPSATDVKAQAVERPGYVVLIGITKRLRVGDQITVTLRFDKAGPVTLELSVSVPTAPRPRSSSEAEHAKHE